MAKKFSLSDFDPEYLKRLEDGLIPRLKKVKYPGWVYAKDISDDPRLFVDAVITLIRNGWFEDEFGHQTLEFGRDDKIRYLHQSERAFIWDENYETSDSVHISQ